MRALSLVLVLAACTPKEPSNADYAVVPLEASQGYLDRKAEYLDYCYENNGPDLGGLYGQLCRVARGDTVNVTAIEESSQKLIERRDTADFTAAALIRMLYLDRETGALDDETRTFIENTLLEFKYWIDEPGVDQMCFWTENHQVLYHSSELLVGQFFADETFPNNGMTGRQHAKHAEPLADRWLNMRGQFGFSEWHSNVYFNEDIPALLNLAEFADNPEIRTKAAAVLDLVAFDLLNNMYKGKFATVHGRTYESKFIDGLNDSTAEAAWIMTGLGAYSSTGDFSGTFLATSDRYFTPQLLEDIATEVSSSHEHRQRDSIDVAEAERWGIGYESQEDMIFFAGMSALLAPEVITGTLEMVDDLDLWNGFLFSDIPAELESILKSAQAAGTLPDLATTLEPVAAGISLQGMDTYVYRTPDYQLAGAQDYHPAYWASQTQMWLGTLDEEAYVFTSYPSDLGAAEDLGVALAGKWIGSWLPRGTLYQNVGIFQYRQEEVPLLATYISSDHTHAYFPRLRFDEVQEQAGWVMGRKGEGYVALYSENPTTWSVENDYELDAEGLENIWIVEMGSASEHGSFADFVAVITASTVTFGDTVVYESPSVGRVEVGWEGPMTVEGEEIDLGPFPRWSNDYSATTFGDPITHIDHGKHRLMLDFTGPERSLLKAN